jgi:hypothetical protein
MAGILFYDFNLFNYMLLMYRSLIGLFLIYVTR